VIRTSPGPNREVKQGRTIEMIVSQGSAWTWVPDVTEMSLARARGKLEEAHLRLGSRQATPDANVPPGYVARQRPAAQTRVRRNSPVDVFLSAPPAAEAPAVKYAQVQVSVPEGEGMQDVRIVVDDDDGERVAHQGQYPPGSQFTRTVAGRGSMTVRVFAGDELLQEKTY
jgi:beta-lactam-binding protein with PASTA domain